MRKSPADYPTDMGEADGAQGRNVKIHRRPDGPSGGEAAGEPSRESTEDEYFGHILSDEKKKLHERIMGALMEKNSRWYEAIMLVYYLETPQAKAAESSPSSVR